MNLAQTLILSIVEGLTEFLPVSSTGHLVLTAHVLNIQQSEFVKSFEIIIQLGAILAVVAVYWKVLLTQTRLWRTLFVAFLPSAVVGLFFYKLIKGFLIGNLFITVIALVLGGVILLAIEVLRPSKAENNQTLTDISTKQALIIGLAQAVSVIPGVSRAGATIVGGLLQGISRKTAVEFSFLLAVPTMAAATGLDVLETRLNFTQQELTMLLVGFIAAFIFALLTIKYFLRFVEKKSFVVFAVYRILAGIIYFFLVLT